MTRVLDTVEKRIVDFTRKSDGKVFPAEIRAYPSRFVESLSGETITVSWQDSENGFTSESVVLTYRDDTAPQWDWENDDFECTFVIPEAKQEVEQQAPRSVSPITEKGTHIPIIRTKNP